MKERIDSNLKKAMLEKDKVIVSVLRMLNSEIHNKEISLRGKQDQLREEQIIQAIQSEVKKRKDSIAAYKKGNRQDLVANESAELKILEKYLPEQMSNQDIENIVRGIIGEGKEASMKDFGRIMGETMKKIKGRADGNKASEIVKKYLK